MKIEVKTIQELVEITAGLVKEGVTFEAHCDTKGLWIINLTGGF